MMKFTIVLLVFPLSAFGGTYYMTINANGGECINKSDIRTESNNISSAFWKHWKMEEGEKNKINISSLNLPTASSAARHAQLAYDSSGRFLRRSYSPGFDSYFIPYDTTPTKTNRRLAVLNNKNKYYAVDNETTGEYGGACTCPDGSIYQVGVTPSVNCESIHWAGCVGGKTGYCNKKKGSWSHKKVQCAHSPLINQFQPEHAMKTINTGTLRMFMKLFCMTRFTYNDIDCDRYKELKCYDSSPYKSEECLKIAYIKNVMRSVATNCVISYFPFTSQVGLGNA
jgi:hypothetical protein